MDTQAAIIDCSINLDEPEQDASLLNALSANKPERVAVDTLRAAGIALDPHHCYSISLVITGDEEMRELNRNYRQQDKPTDVLSFPLLDTPLVHAPADQLWSTGEDGDLDNADEQREPHPAFVTPAELATNLGDIVISWPTVMHQAAQAGHHPLYELFYLFSHGILHLVGYDDQTEAGYAAMVGIQEAVMRGIEWESITG